MKVFVSFMALPCAKPLTFARLESANTLQGAEAYQPDEYGPTITVTRKIRRSGASEYFLGEHGCKVLMDCPALPWIVMELTMAPYCC